LIIKIRNGGIAAAVAIGGRGAAVLWCEIGAANDGVAALINSGANLIKQRVIKETLRQLRLAVTATARRNADVITGQLRLCEQQSTARCIHADAWHVASVIGIFGA